jgi:hypothetical protein
MQRFPVSLSQLHHIKHNAHLKAQKHFCSPISAMNLTPAGTNGRCVLLVAH